MQLQIECNRVPLQKQQCLICDGVFEMAARVIVCNNRGKSYGEVCPHCLKEGFNWLSDRFDRMHKVQKIDIARRARTQKIPVSV